MSADEHSGKQWTQECSSLSPVLPMPRRLQVCRFLDRLHKPLEAGLTEIHKNDARRDDDVGKLPGDVGASRERNGVEADVRVVVAVGSTRRAAL